MSKISETMKIAEEAKQAFAALSRGKNGRPNGNAANAVYRAAFAKLNKIGVSDAAQGRIIGAAFEAGTGLNRKG